MPTKPGAFRCLCTIQLSVITLQQAARTLVLLVGLLVGLAELCMCCCRPGLTEVTQMTSSLPQSVQSISCRCCVSPMQCSRKGEAGARAASSSPPSLGSPAVARHPHATPPGRSSQFAVQSTSSRAAGTCAESHDMWQAFRVQPAFSVHGSLQRDAFTAVPCPQAGPLLCGAAEPNMVVQ